MYSCVFELHSNNLFCSPEIIPTVDQINHSFGPTHPGGRHTVCMYMLGCAVLLCLVVSLTLLASFFLPSRLSLKHVHIVTLGVSIHCTQLCSCYYLNITISKPPISRWSSPSPAGPPHLPLVLPICRWSSPSPTGSMQRWTRVRTTTSSTSEESSLPSPSGLHRY